MLLWIRAMGIIARIPGIFRSEEVVEMMAKKLTRNQKIMLTEVGWDASEYLLLRDLPDSMVLRNKSGETVIFVKGTASGE